MFFQTLVAIVFCAAVVQGRNITVQNIGSESLVVSVTGQDDITLLSGLSVVITVPEDFSGAITAVAAGAEVTEFLTQAEITLGETSDLVGVSLTKGFNRRAKIVAMNSDCSGSVCMADLLALCPVANQQTDSVGTVQACSNEPTIFKTICPTAVVSSTDVAVTCTGTPSYRVMFG